MPLFSIITPSYNMLRFLPACCNSVSDQGVDYEHIVVDAASVDGTVSWLKEHPRLVSISEKDDGMYDAINKGVGIAKGEIISYLNCDEQYLPGVLQSVGEIFRQHPRINLLFGNTVLIRPNGELLAYRKSFIPRWPYIWASHLYIHSSSMFVRRRVFESGMMFDKKWKAIGDMDFVIRALRKGFAAYHVSEYYSAYTMTGANLGHAEQAFDELKTYRKQAPFWLRFFRPMMRLMMLFEKAWNGAYQQRTPLSYSVYTSENLEVRTNFSVRSVSPLYPRNV